MIENNAKVSLLELGVSSFGCLFKLHRLIEHEVELRGIAGRVAPRHMIAELGL